MGPPQMIEAMNLPFHRVRSGDTGEFLSKSRQGAVNEVKPMGYLGSLLPG